MGILFEFLRLCIPSEASNLHVIMFRSPTGILHLVAQPFTGVNDLDSRKSTWANLFAENVIVKVSRVVGTNWA